MVFAIGWRRAQVVRSSKHAAATGGSGCRLEPLRDTVPALDDNGQ